MVEIVTPGPKTFVGIVTTTGPGRMMTHHIALTATGDVYIGKWTASQDNPEAWVLKWEPFGSVVEGEGEQPQSVPLKE